MEAKFLLLDSLVLTRFPSEGVSLSLHYNTIESILLGFKFPLIIKPNHNCHSSFCGLTVLIEKIQKF